MLQQLDNSLIVKLAAMLVETSENSEAITEALELICKAAVFDCGFIYEVDYSNELCLMEHYVSDDSAFEANNKNVRLTTQEQCILSDKQIFYIKKGSSNTPLENKLLSLHNSSFILLVPVADKKKHICGFLALLNASTIPVVEDACDTVLSILLSMLLNYASRRMYQHRLIQSGDILENILENTGIDIYVNDLHDHDILYVNESMAAPYGGREMFDGKKCWEVLFPGQDGPCSFCPKNRIVDENGAPSEVYTWDYQRAFDGSWFRVFSAAFYRPDGRLAHVVSSADITDNKKNEAIIENLANFDQLTKLPNRRMLIKECERRIDNATATEQGYVMFFDIDGFKAINDNFGHDAGDEFLIALGEFFTSIPLLKNNVYRNGGDEFVAVVGGESISKANMKSLVHFIHKRFEKPWKLKKGDAMCGISVGIACFPDDGIYADVLIQKADMAMYKVKKTGGGGCCFVYQLNEN